MKLPRLCCLTLLSLTWPSSGSRNYVTAKSLRHSLFLIFLCFVCGAAYGQVQECQIGNRTINVPTPTGSKRIDRLNHSWDEEMNALVRPIRVLMSFGDSEDYARLLSGQFPVLRESYFVVQVTGDADWTTVDQNGFDRYKKSLKKMYGDSDSSRLKCNENVLKQIKALYPNAHGWWLGDVEVGVLQESSSSIIFAEVSPISMPATYVMRGTTVGPRCVVMASTLISGKIVVQYCDSPYASPEDLVTAVRALQGWRDQTLIKNAN
jgi:hypothetical protein